MPTTITVCDTCKLSDWDATRDPMTDGEKLAALIETAAGQGIDVKSENPQVQVRRHSCLLGCDHGCNVAIQSHGKINYVLGRFDPDQNSAEGIVEYAGLHAQSATGQVPYRTWPVAIKGHFVARLPVLPADPPTKDDPAS
jgi:predicted metal-binding protein